MSPLRCLLLGSLLLAVGAAQAAIETYEFDDDTLLERYQVLSAELRCPKCQNQNIAGSNAPIAAYLRKQLYQQLQAGRSDAEITDYMVQRYGEFVLYRPRWDKVTLVLWLAPLILLALAGWILFSTLRGNRTTSRAVSLSEEEQRRLDELLRREQQGDAAHRLSVRVDQRALELSGIDLGGDRVRSRQRHGEDGDGGGDRPTRLARHTSHLKTSNRTNTGSGSSGASKNNSNRLPLTPPAGVGK